MEIARLVVGLVLLVVTGVLTIMLWNGRWAWIIAQPQKTKKGTFYPEGTLKTAQRAAWMMVASFAVVATLMAWGMAQMTGMPAFVQTAEILGAIALVAFCVSVVATVLSARGERGILESFRDGGMRLPMFLLFSCTLMTFMSLMFV